jgi:hypothetical protein
MEKYRDERKLLVMQLFYLVMLLLFMNRLLHTARCDEYPQEIMQSYEDLIVNSGMR